LRDALHPAPQKRGAADQRDDACENTREAHVIPSLIALTRSDAGASQNLVVDTQVRPHVEHIPKMSATQMRQLIEIRPRAESALHDASPALEIRA